MKLLLPHANRRDKKFASCGDLHYSFGIFSIFPTCAEEVFVSLQVISRFRILFAPVFLLLLFHQAYSGTLDPTFGTGGKVTVDFPFSSSTNYTSDGYYIFVQPWAESLSPDRIFSPDRTASRREWLWRV